MSSAAGRAIVTGFDGSESARHAAFWAADEARRRGVALRLVTAVHMPVAGYPAPVSLITDFTEELAVHARAALDALRAELLRANDGLEIATAVHVGLANPVLIKESADAVLVVLGSRGLGGFSGVLVGSTAVALSAHGHCPVAVVRAGPPDGPVVVGVDGSPASEVAVAQAFEEASLRGADLVAVHVWSDYTSEGSYAAASLFVADWDQIEAQEHEILAERLAGWQEKYPDVPVRRVVVHDRPVRALLEQAKDARLLVVGSRGRGGFGGMLLGSTSQALVYHAPCPLLVCRGTG